MRKGIKVIALALLALLGVVLVCLCVFAGVYFTRFQTMSTIQRESSYGDYNLYSMDIEYDYNIDDVIACDINDEQDIFDAIVKESLPLLPVKIEAPSFGCSAFSLETVEGSQLMGRNYDFKKNTSAMLVRCSPKDGYRSIAFAALANISANVADEGLKTKVAALTAPFICLDGVNEKGVSIAVLVVDSEPVHQDTDKQNIFTTLAIRLVLDRAASTEEAVELLRGYDMIASSGKDYHFYISDASGDGRVVEYDCESPTRELVATPVDVVTNFYALYADKVLPNQKNGPYGHGKERYEAICDVLAAQEGGYSVATAWDALRAASQAPVDGDVTSNTQWSIVFNNTDLTAQIVMRRNWDDVYECALTDGSVKKLAN